jgi:hypothetical protein
MSRMESEYHVFVARRTGTLLFSGHDSDVSDYINAISLARIERDSHTTVGELRRTNQIVHYLRQVYRCGPAVPA